MARKMDYRPTRFGLEHSDAIEENDRIIEAGRQQRQENREKREENVEQSPATEESNATTSNDASSTQVVEQSAPTYGTDIVMNAYKQKGKKTENGITIYVPMEYYERIVMMKMRTGVPIKDLALQAVIEFLDKNK